jgi:hypothetical protein
MRKRGANNFAEEQYWDSVNKEDIDGVAMRFICEQPLSHSDDEIGTVLTELFNGNNSSGICQPDILEIYK